MSWALVRVDDRLIHGQVVVAWGQRLQPARIWVADDDVAASGWEVDLLRSAAPDADVRVRSLAAVADAWDEEAAAGGVAFLLVRDLPSALALRRAGARFDRLNLGGLHYAPGKSKVNEYVYLDERDRECARELAALGVALEVQDVPAAKAVALATLDPAIAAP
jgi:mannose/fructose/N-acetylgalactosamine-specific phosphotransferase system component IIB